MSRFLLVSVFLLLRITTTQAFNLDLRTALVYQGPKGSHFGFSVAIHKDRNTSWVLVGAPRAQTAQRGVDRGGAVYRCGVADHQTCTQVPFDLTSHTEEMFEGVSERVADKSHQWFGATVASSGPNGVVVACAPRYVYYTSNLKRKDPVGACYVAPSHLNSAQEFAPCRSTEEWGYHRQGFCQAGFSIALTEDGKKLFVGAVGSFYWQGQVYAQELLMQQLPLSTAEQPAQYDDSYLGYAMAVGEFTDDDDQDVVVSMPRGANLTGKVVLYNSSLAPILELAGEQIGSYFGYSLCVARLDGDAHDDVIVGAPMYSDFEAKDGSYETGRVYVVYQGGKKSDKRFQRWHILDGQSSRSRFGASLAALGDLNKDGHQDLAVGAPYAGDDYRGAVYIFHGSTSGVVPTPSQVIYAKEVHSAVKTFGFSISSNADVDHNEYPDLVVGAYDSNIAILLKSRPVVTVSANLVVEPQDINLEEKSCSLLDGTPVSCIVVTTCLEYSGFRVPSSLDFRVKVVLDSKHNKGSSRLFFLTNEQENRQNATASLHKDSLFCRQVYVYIKTNVQDKLSPITVQMNYSLADSDKNKKLVRPILNRYVPSTLSQQANILKNCGNDNVCIPELQIDLDARPKTYKMGSGDRLRLFVDVRNRGEDSFETFVFVNVPVGVNYVNVDRSNMERLVACSGPREDDNRTLSCEVGNPLPSNTQVSFSIILMPSYVNFSDGGAYVFHAHVNSTNPEKNNSLSNNAASTRVEVKVEAHLALTGVPKDDAMVNYNKSMTVIADKTRESDIGPLVVHLYDVSNSGPSQILEAEVVILWPTYTLSGRHLLYLLDQPEVRGKGRCEFIDNVNPLNLTLERTDYRSNSPVVVRLMDDGATPNATAPYATGIEDVETARKRRSNTESSAPDFHKELSCGPTLCTQIHCRMYNLVKSEHVFFEIRSRLWTETLNELGFDNVTISSKMVARVTKLPYSVQLSNDYKVFVITTTVNPMETTPIGRRITWWIVAVAACAGVLLYAIVVLTLWKLGFFKRKRPHDEFERQPLNKPEKNGRLEIGDEFL